MPYARSKSIELNPLADCAFDWIGRLGARKAKRHTINGYARAVMRFGRWLGERFPTVKKPSDVDSLHVKRFLDAESVRIPRSVSNTYDALRVWGAWVSSTPWAREDPVLGVERPKVSADSAVRPLTMTELRKLRRAVAGDELRQHRDRAVFELLRMTGGPITSLLSLQFQDVDSKARAILLRPAQPDRNAVRVALDAEAREALRTWLKARAISGAAGDSVFVGYPNGRVSGGELTDRAIRRRFNEAAERAGIRGPRVSLMSLARCV